MTARGAGLTIVEPPLGSVMHERRRQREIGGRTVARDRNGVDHRDPQQCLLVGVKRGARADPEEDDEIEPARDSRACPHILNVPATCAWTH